MAERARREERWLPPMSYYAKIALTLIAVGAVLAAAWSVRSVLMLVLIAAVLAIGLDPAVRRLERLRLSRGWAVTAIFLAALGFVAVFVALIVPPLVREAGELAEDIPGYLEELEQGGGWVGEQVRRYDLADRLKEFVEDLPSKVSDSFGTIFGVTRSVASLIFNSLTIAILTIYFLTSLPELRHRIGLVVADEREPVMDEAVERIGGYVSGNIIVSVIAGVAAYVVLRILGVPFAAALAMWVAVADLIPTVGAILGAIVCVAVAFFSSVADGVATSIYFTVYQQVENYVIQPRVMKKAVDLSPAAVIVSVMIGASLAGFAGALLALPIAAAAKVFVRDIWLRPRIARLEAEAEARSGGTAPASS